MKRLAISLLGGVFFAAVATVAAQAAPPDISGNWKVEQSGANGGSTATVQIKQNGNSIVGASSAGNNFQGKFKDDSQIDATWHGPGGAGWLTVYVSPNGHSFNGTWGYNGRKPNGTFVGNKFLPPSKITAAGTWNLQVTGTNQPPLVSGQMTCTESGLAVVCKANGLEIDGRFRETTKVRATFKTQDGKTGWFSFWFNNDNNSFNGIWGYGTDMTAPAGRIVGQRAM